ncbi:hypothetical protein FNV43_RR14689 [Rhamnella rubrinervis]|uniref:Uncharacterized protein n=1 Tax=Rhamnella rubrinervis TaxID=2594499 RepID=A0A8K0MGG8_9ROSA|nr:hypothetical protein FNV43_RR14689 [Rhamnella rubrinervis]
MLNGIPQKQREHCHEEDGVRVDEQILSWLGFGPGYLFKASGSRPNKVPPPHQRKREAQCSIDNLFKRRCTITDLLDEAHTNMLTTDQERPILCEEETDSMEPIGLQTTINSQDGLATPFHPRTNTTATRSVIKASEPTHYKKKGYSEY